MRAAVLLLTLLLPAFALADEVPGELKVRFNELSLAADRALAGKGVEAAIRVLEQGLLDLDDDYGRVHLKLGELCQQAGRVAEAAAHFRACDADERVDATDRELFCRAGLEAVTTTLSVTDLPSGARVIVIEPEGFTGAFESGGRLPKGPVRLTVEATGRQPRESVLELGAPTTWQAVLGDPWPAGASPASTGAVAPGIADAVRPVEPAPSGVGRWPAYATAGVGAALIASGLYLGFDAQSQRDEARDRQTRGDCPSCRGALDDAGSQALTADVLWISGAVVVGGATALFFILGDD